MTRSRRGDEEDDDVAEVVELAEDEDLVEVDELVDDGVAEAEELLEDDVSEVETGLPEPPAPAPLTEERDQRLEVIKAEITEVHTRYKRHAQRTLRYAVRMGVCLIEAKDIVGHGPFLTWVRDNCPFSHRTANIYMYVARTNLKFERVANLAEQGTVDAIENHLSKKGAARFRRLEAQGKPPSLQRIYESRQQRKRQSKKLSFRDKRMFNQQQHRAAQQSRSEQYQAQDLPDLTELWPRPHRDAARIEIEWQLPDEVIQTIYVWLPEDGHATAAGAVKKRSWKGSMALRYHWLIYTKGSNAEDYSVAIDDDHFDGKTWTVGKTWEEVQAKLSELSRNATGARRAQEMDRDPDTARILDNWREMILHYRR
jgi:hypothetical protein